METYRPEGLSRSEDCSLRWLVKISSWHPSIEEWDFLKRLLPIQEQEQVSRFQISLSLAMEVDICLAREGNQKPATA